MGAPSHKPRDLVARLQAFHGFYIDLERSAQGWHLYIRDTGFRFVGSTAQVISCLTGYQAGWLAGRKYSGEEQHALKVLIKEMEGQFSKGGRGGTI